MTRSLTVIAIAASLAAATPAHAISAWVPLPGLDFSPTTPETTPRASTKTPTRGG